MPDNQAENFFVVDPAGRSYCHPKVELKGASYTVTRADSGKIFVATAVDVVFTLPSTVAGLVYRFVAGIVSVTTGLSISPAALDTINGGTDNKDWINTPATDVVNDYAEIHGNGGDGWIVIGQQGIWAEEA